jgi:hypothetical protein
MFTKHCVDTEQTVGHGLKTNYTILDGHAGNYLLF